MAMFDSRSGFALNPAWIDSVVMFVFRVFF
jgi:hypothetical protein